MTRKYNFLAGVRMTAAEQAAGRYLRAPDGHPDPAPAAAPAEGGDQGTKPDDSSAFDAAFAEHASEPAAADGAAEGGDPGSAPAADGAAAPAEGEGTDGSAPADGAAAPKEGEAPPAEGGTPPASPEGAAAPAEAGASPDDILARLAGLINKAPEAAPAAAQPAAEPPAPQLYTQDEQAILAEYEKNWPDVAKAEELKRRAEYHDIIKFVFENMTQYVGPIADQVRAMGNTLHIGELKAAVPDYSENLEADVAAWVDTQPSYLQAGMKQVMQSGTSEEVADLIGRYRAATGTAPAAQAPAVPAAAPVAAGTPAPVAAPKTELSSAAKQAAESLAPVSGDRSVVPEGENSQDYESAFAKYASTMDG